MSSIGCASPSRKVLASMMEDGLEDKATYSGSLEMGSASGPPLKLSDKDLNLYREFERSEGPLTVEGPRDSRRLIELLARHGGETLEETKRELGIETDLKMNFVLVPMDSDSLPSKFEFEFQVQGSELTNPLLVDPGTDSLAALLRGAGPSGYDMLTSGVAGHEFFEISLFFADSNMGIAPDVELDWNGIPLRVRNCTRWYRDGFATYAAMVWLEKLNDRAGIAPEDRVDVVFLDEAEESFERVGPRLFRWSQFKPNRNQPLYEASLGMFLELETTFGRERIRAWNEAIADSTDEYKGRADLLRAAKEVFGVDLRTFARRARR